LVIYGLDGGFVFKKKKDQNPNLDGRGWTSKKSYSFSVTPHCIQNLAFMNPHQDFRYGPKIPASANSHSRAPQKKKTVRTGITLTKLKGYSEAIELISWRSTGNQLEVDVAKLIPASGLDAPTPGGP